MYKYTICFIRQGDQLLMLNRDFPPAKGLWNGVGGRVEGEETALACVLREIKEETGLELDEVEYKGTITWNNTAYSGGMYVYLGIIPEGYTYSTPRRNDEGILDWKNISWVLDADNLGVSDIIPKVLPYVLNDGKCYEHQCEVINYRLVHCHTRAI